MNYSFGIIKWTKFELDEIDRMMRKIIAKYCCMNLHSNTNRLYLSRKKGGKGLLNIHHMHNRTLCSLVTYIFNAKSEHAKLIKEFWISKSAGTLLKKAEEILFNANINISFTRAGTIYESSLIDSKKVSKLLKIIYEKQYQHSWLNSTLHGKILKGCIDDGADVQASFQWLMSANLRGEAVSSIFAIQEQMIATRVIRKRIWKENIISEKCRVCDQSIESISHIVSSCTPLADKQYKDRHDNMLRGVYYYLLQSLNFTDMKIPSYDLNHVELVKENKICKIYWDTPIRTSNYVKYNKPDIVVIFKQKDDILIIEGSCPWDENLQKVILEKRSKYISLSNELKLMYGKRKCRIIELVMGSTGIVDKTFKEGLRNITESKLDVEILFNECQKAAILGTVRICRAIITGTSA